MTKPIKICFIDPSGEIDPTFYTPIYNFIASQFDIEIVPSTEAEFVIYSDIGIEHQHVKGIKIFITAENHAARWIDTDYAFTHVREESERHMRLPYWAQALIMEKEAVTHGLVTRPAISLEELQAQNRKFANFVYRNHVCQTRNKFFNELNQYKRVDSAGPWLNNMPEGWVLPSGWHQNQAFVKQYKFTISFENESHPGYTTEKITHPLIGRSVPIYWGDPQVSQDFNVAAYINYHDFDSEAALIKHIIEVDNNDELLLSYLNAPALLHQKQLDEIRLQFAARIAQIFTTAQYQRSSTERTLYLIDKAIGRNALKRFKAWKRRTFPKKKPSLARGEKNPFQS